MLKCQNWHPRELQLSKGSTRREMTSLYPQILFFLTFCLPKIPDFIEVWSLQIKVSLFIPSLLHCINCQYYNHRASFCKSQASCFRCGNTGHAAADCSSSNKWENCDRSHVVSSRDCRKWKEEAAIQHVCAQSGVHYVDVCHCVVGDSSGASSSGSSNSYLAAVTKRLSTSVSI